MRSKKEIEDCKKRIVEFICNYLNISQREFCSMAGLSSNWIGTWGGVLRMQTKAKIEKAYPELNIDWVLTGEGKMIKEVKNSDGINITNNKTYRGRNSGNTAGRDIIIGESKASLEAQISALRAELAAKNKEIERQQATINKLIEKISHG